MVGARGADDGLSAGCSLGLAELLKGEHKWAVAEDSYRTALASQQKVGEREVV